MKTAIWILSVATVGLAIFAFMQWRTIQKLTPSVPGTAGNRTTDDGSASFARQLDATKQAIKDLEIKATFQS